MTQREEQQKLERYRVPQVGELLDERYRIKGVLATGGMGMILRAEQLPMERPVAIKVLHPQIAVDNPELVGRFQREVRLAKELNHPHTIRLYDFGESDTGLVYVAMEYLEGADLKGLLADQGALAVGRALEITRQMLDGLAEAHAREFIHRDLKPSNVFVTTSRRGDDLIKLLDFGIAKSLEDARSDLTDSGTVCGTPSYVAPEYLLNQVPGKPADVYAVGLMLLEMLTGRKVFCGDDPVQTLMMQIKVDAPIPAVIVGSPLGRLIARSACKEPDRRYVDAEQMYEAVCEVMERISGAVLARRLDRGDAVDVPAERAEADTARSLDLPAGAENSEVAGRLRWLVAIGATFLMAFVVLAFLNPGPQASAVGVDTVSESTSRGSAAQLQTAGKSHRETHEASADAQPEEAVYHFELHSDPSGARVSIGERDYGRAPVDFEVEPAELPVEVDFALDGHRSASRTLTPTSPPIIVEMLAEKPPPKTYRKRSKSEVEQRSADKAAAQPGLSAESIEQVVDYYLSGGDDPSSAGAQP